MPDQPSKAKLLFGDFAPKFVSLLDDVVYADVWERPELSKRDRSLITVATLVALYRSAELRPHMGLAIENGLTVEELKEAIMHIAFYAGWPTAMSAMTMAMELFDTAE